MVGEKILIKYLIRLLASDKLKGLGHNLSYSSDCLRIKTEMQDVHVNILVSLSNPRDHVISIALLRAGSRLPRSTRPYLCCAAQL
jgi:hypothetical protein